MHLSSSTRPHPVLLASQATGASLAQRVEVAFQWLCKSRQQCHPNHPVWHFRWNWQRWKPELLRRLRATTPSYCFSPVRRVATATGERLECWEPQGALDLSPLDRAMAGLTGIRYFRFMDDWVILAETRWQLRRAVRLMNQVLAHLGLEQHPDKTFIGRVSRGFDFLGIDFQPSAPLAASAVSHARKTEKIARLYEQVSSPERIGRYDMHWQRWLHRVVGQPKPAATVKHTPPPLHPTRPLSDDLSVSSHLSLPGRGGSTKHKTEKK